jgi:thymidylate synthase
MKTYNATKEGSTKEGIAASTKEAIAASTKEARASSTKGDDVKDENKDENKANHEEQQYLDLLTIITKDGCWKNDRTQVGTVSLFGKMMTFTLLNRQLPLLTTKKMFVRGVFEELMWILRGQTDSKLLEAKGVGIWKGNSSRAFLDNCGMQNYREGDCGAIYGFQLRHFGAKYVNCETDYKGLGTDQLNNVMRILREDPDSRRAMITFLNPADISCLPACHALVVFETTPSPIEGQSRILSGMLTQRSADMFLGVPFNIASYALLITLMAHQLGYQPGKFVHVLGNAHIYKSHLNVVKEQISRVPYTFPKLTIKTKRERITDYQWTDLEIEEYRSHPALSAPMAV